MRREQIAKLPKTDHGRGPYVQKSSDTAESDFDCGVVHATQPNETKVQKHLATSSTRGASGSGVPENVMHNVRMTKGGPAQGWNNHHPLSPKARMPLGGQIWVLR